MMLSCGMVAGEEEESGSLFSAVSGVVFAVDGTLCEGLFLLFVNNTVTRMMDVMAVVVMIAALADKKGLRLNAG